MSIIFKYPLISTSPPKRIKQWEKASDILLIPKDHRTEAENKLLIDVMSRVAYFENAHSNSSDGYEDFIDKCCSSMQVERFGNHDPIFHYGEPGRKFYLILVGNVHIFIPKSSHEIIQDLDILENEVLKIKPMTTITVDMLAAISKIRSELVIGNEINPFIPLFTTNDVNQDQEYKSTSENVLQPKSKKYQALANAWQFIDYSNLCDPETLTIFSKSENSMHYIENGIFKFKKIRILGPGDSFGELALTTNKSRTATAIAFGDIKVASLSKSDYRIIFETVIEKIYAKYNFFKAFFANCSADSISKFAYNFQEKRLKYGQKLYQQGEEPKELYAIIKGEVQLIIQEERNPLKKQLKAGEQFLETEYQKKTKLINLGSGAFVGEEEVLKNIKRIATATSVSGETVVYSLNVEEFKTLRNRYPELIKSLMDMMEARSVFHKERFNYIKDVQEVITSNYEKALEVKEPKISLRGLFNSESNSIPKSHTKPLITYTKPHLDEEIPVTESQTARLEYNNNTNNNNNNLLRKSDISLALTTTLAGINELPCDQTQHQQDQQVRSSSIINLMKMSKEFNKKCYIRHSNNPNTEKNQLSHVTPDKKAVGCYRSRSYISSRANNEHDIIRLKDPLDMIESKMKLAKSQEKYFVPVDIEAPLFSRDYSNLLTLSIPQANYHSQSGTYPTHRAKSSSLSGIHNSTNPTRKSSGTNLSQPSGSKPQPKAKKSYNLAQAIISAASNGAMSSRQPDDIPKPNQQLSQNSCHFPLSLFQNYLSENSKQTIEISKAEATGDKLSKIASLNSRIDEDSEPLQPQQPQQTNQKKPLFKIPLLPKKHIMASEEDDPSKSETSHPRDVSHLRDGSNLRGDYGKESANQSRILTNRTCISTIQPDLNNNKTFIIHNTQSNKATAITSCNNTILSNNSSFIPIRSQRDRPETTRESLGLIELKAPFSHKKLNVSLSLNQLHKPTVIKKAETMRDCRLNFMGITENSINDGSNIELHKKNFIILKQNSAKKLPSPSRVNLNSAQKLTRKLYNQ